jgi:hypothetical protein
MPLHLIKLSPTRGINAEHLLKWQDLPEGGQPSLLLTLGVPAAQEGPSTLTLVGEERRIMLRWLDRQSDLVAPPLSGEPEEGYESPQDSDDFLTT